MEFAPPAYNPHLTRVLQSYQCAAVKSLNGPSSHVNAWGTDAYRKHHEMRMAGKELKVDIPYTPKVNVNIPEPTPVNVPYASPLFTPMDATRSEKSETILEGEKIACFIVGGEKRLCLPQILNTVLRDFKLEQINEVCDHLHVYCSRCNTEQLQILKATQVLPGTAPSCGLITKTDAERLCNALLHRNPEKSREPPGSLSFLVYHECFGKCKGIFSPERYISPSANCIECVDCHGLFSPQKFVVHSHKSVENRTCHWGFDSANWRSYMLLSKDQDHLPRCQDTLDTMKARYDTTMRYKRKESASEKDDAKRLRCEESWANGSAFRPWSPGLIDALKEGKIPPQFHTSMGHVLPAYLNTGHPVLLNPERVVPSSETSRYERHFAPNVSLAPATYNKAKEDADRSPRDTPLPPSPVATPTLSRKRSMSPKPSTSYERMGRRSLEDELEIDVSSSDTESTVHSEYSVPTTPHHVDSSGRGCLLSPSASSVTSSEAEVREVELFRQACELSDDAECAKLLDDFRALTLSRSRREHALMDTIRTLKQEFERVREERDSYKNQLNSINIAKIQSKFEAELDTIRRDLACTKQENRQMRSQISALQHTAPPANGQPEAKVARTEARSSPTTPVKVEAVNIKQEREEEVKTPSS